MGDKTQFSMEAFMALFDDALAEAHTAALDGTLRKQAPLVAVDAYVAQMLDALAQAEARWEQLHADDYFLLQSATVYDYNRAGVVAFKSEFVPVELLKMLADERRDCVVMVFPAWQQHRPDADAAADGS